MEIRQTKRARYPLAFDSAPIDRKNQFSSRPASVSADQKRVYLPREALDAWFPQDDRFGAWLNKTFA